MRTQPQADADPAQRAAQGVPRAPGGWLLRPAAARARAGWRPNNRAHAESGPALCPAPTVRTGRAETRAPGNSRPGLPRAIRLPLLLTGAASESHRDFRSATFEAAPTRAKLPRALPQ